jgi:hypothetical protein
MDASMLSSMLEERATWQNLHARVQGTRPRLAQELGVIIADGLEAIVDMRTVDGKNGHEEVKVWQDLGKNQLRLAHGLSRVNSREKSAIVELKTFLKVAKTVFDDHSATITLCPWGSPPCSLETILKRLFAPMLRPGKLISLGAIFSFVRGPNFCKAVQQALCAALIVPVESICARLMVDGAKLRWNSPRQSGGKLSALADQLWQRVLFFLLGSKTVYIDSRTNIPMRSCLQKTAMRVRGLDAFEKEAKLRQLPCRPPLSEADVASIVASEPIEVPVDAKLNICLIGSQLYVPDKKQLMLMRAIAKLKLINLHSGAGDLGRCFVEYLNHVNTDDCGNIGLDTGLLFYEVDRRMPNQFRLINDTMKLFSGDMEMLRQMAMVPSPAGAVVTSIPLLEGGAIYLQIMRMLARLSGNRLAIVEKPICHKPDFDASRRSMELQLCLGVPKTHITFSRRVAYRILIDSSPGTKKNTSVMHELFSKKRDGVGCVVRIRHLGVEMLDAPITEIIRQNQVRSLEFCIDSASYQLASGVRNTDPYAASNDVIQLNICESIKLLFQHISSLEVVTVLVDACGCMCYWDFEEPAKMLTMYNFITEIGQHGDIFFMKVSK